MFKYVSQCFFFKVKFLSFSPTVGEHYWVSSRHFIRPVNLEQCQKEQKIFRKFWNKKLRKIICLCESWRDNKKAWFPENYNNLISADVQKSAVITCFWRLLRLWRSRNFDRKYRVIVSVWSIFDYISKFVKVRLDWRHFLVFQLHNL